MLVLTLGYVVVSAIGGVKAFQSSSMKFNQKTRSSSSLMVTVDPTTVTKKEYEDICGVSFDSESLEKRLGRTSFLYPKHVEVIEDIAPIAGAMVDEIVSVATVRYELDLQSDSTAFFWFVAFGDWRKSVATTGLFA